MTPPATNFWRIAGMSYLQVRIVVLSMLLYIFIQFRSTVDDVVLCIHYAIHYAIPIPIGENRLIHYYLFDESSREIFQRFI